MARPSEALFEFASNIWKSVGFGNLNALGIFAISLLISGIFVAGLFFPAFASSLAWAAGGTVGLITGITALVLFSSADGLVAIVLAAMIGLLFGGVTVATAAAIAYVAPVVTAILLLPNIIAGTAAILGGVSYCLESICFGIAACLQAVGSCLYNCLCCCCKPRNTGDDSPPPPSHRSQPTQGMGHRDINQGFGGGSGGGPGFGNSSSSGGSPAYNPNQYGSMGSTHTFAYDNRNQPPPSAPPPPYSASAASASASASAGSQRQPQDDTFKQYLNFLDTLSQASASTIRHAHVPTPPVSHHYHSAAPSASPHHYRPTAASASSQNHSTMHQPASRTQSTNSSSTANNKVYAYGGGMGAIVEKPFQPKKR